MRKFLISAVSLAALTAGGMALAEDPAATTTQGTTTEQMNQPAQPATDQNAAQPSAEQPSTTVLPKADDSTAQQQPSTTDPATTTAEQPTTTDPAKTAEQPTTTDPATTTAEQPTSTDPATTTAEQPATGSAGFTITGLEAGNVMMASSLIGSTIYTSANENIGDINDVVIAKDGKVLAAIIGVGGFLGLGEKDVAVPMDRIQFARDENNNMKFTISASREELEQAPAFDRTKLIVGGEAAPAAQ